MEKTSELKIKLVNGGSQITITNGTTITRNFGEPRINDWNKIAEFLQAIWKDEDQLQQPWIQQIQISGMEQQQPWTQEAQPITQQQQQEKAMESINIITDEKLLATGFFWEADEVDKRINEVENKGKQLISNYKSPRGKRVYEEKKDEKEEKEKRVEELKKEIKKRRKELYQKAENKLRDEYEWDAADCINENVFKQD